MQTAASAREESGPIVLFDGVCNLCNATVRFVLERDRLGSLRFASLQSDVGQRLLEPFDVVLGEGDPGTVYLIEDGRLFDRSTAALRLARHMRGLWPLASVYLVVPRVLRDAVYDFIAARRYRWFGRSDVCRIPTADEAERFLT